MARTGRRGSPSRCPASSTSPVAEGSRWTAGHADLAARSLTGLRGLRYEVRTTDERTIPAITYADWGELCWSPAAACSSCSNQTVRRCSTS
jgi:hypothetical protein